MSMITCEQHMFAKEENKKEARGWNKWGVWIGRTLYHQIFADGYYDRDRKNLHASNSNLFLHVIYRMDDDL